MGTSYLTLLAFNFNRIPFMSCDFQMGKNNAKRNIFVLIWSFNGNNKMLKILDSLIYFQRINQLESKKLLQFI